MHETCNCSWVSRNLNCLSLLAAQYAHVTLCLSQRDKGTKSRNCRGPVLIPGATSGGRGCDGAKSATDDNIMVMVLAMMSAPDRVQKTKM